jgi:hypothetical protein
MTNAPPPIRQAPAGNFPGARRIVLLGPAGAGKTTFSRRLGAALGAPVLCLDAIRAEIQDHSAFRARLDAAHAAPAWVSDGNFAKATFDLRLPRADLIVWLDPPGWLCVWRAVTRTLRPDEPHRPRDLPRVLRFIAGFDRVNRPKIEAERQAHGAAVPVVTLRSDAEARRFLAAVSAQAS